MTSFIIQVEIEVNRMLDQRIDSDAMDQPQHLRGTIRLGM